MRGQRSVGEQASSGHPGPNSRLWDQQVAAAASEPAKAAPLSPVFLLQRLRPVTVERPKVLLPLVNTPMLDYTLHWLAANEVSPRPPAYVVWAAALPAALLQWAGCPRLIVWQAAALRKCWGRSEGCPIAGRGA